MEGEFAPGVHGDVVEDILVNGDQGEEDHDAGTVVETLGELQDGLLGVDELQRLLMQEEVGLGQVYILNLLLLRLSWLILRLDLILIDRHLESLQVVVPLT